MLDLGVFLFEFYYVYLLDILIKYLRLKSSLKNKRTRTITGSVTLTLRAA